MFFYFVFGWISVRRSVVCDYSKRSPGVVLHLRKYSLSLSSQSLPVVGLLG